MRSQGVKRDSALMNGIYIYIVQYYNRAFHFNIFSTLVGKYCSYHQFKYDKTEMQGDSEDF